MPMQPSSLSLLIAGRKWQSGKRDSDGSVPRLLLYPPKAVIFHFSPKVSNVPQPDQGVRSKTSATQRSSGASVDLGRPDTSAAAQNAGDAGRSRFAVARDVRTDHPGVATARRVRSELGWCLNLDIGTKRDHCDADCQIRYRRYGSSPKARPTIPLFS